MTTHEDLPLDHTPTSPAASSAPTAPPTVPPPASPSVAPTAPPWISPPPHEPVPDPAAVPGAAAPASRRPRRVPVLAIVAGLVLLLGVGVAVAGLITKSNAEQDAEDAAQELIEVTDVRDQSVQSRDSATGEAAEASAELATVTVEAQRVSSIAAGAAIVADQFAVCDQRLSDGVRESLAAIDTQDLARAERALEATDAAITACNDTTAAYDAAITAFYTDAPAGTETA